jgi:hypothetical protein
MPHSPFPKTAEIIVCETSSEPPIPVKPIVESIREVPIAVKTVVEATEPPSIETIVETTEMATPVEPIVKAAPIKSIIKAAPIKSIVKATVETITIRSTSVPAAVTRIVTIYELVSLLIPFIIAATASPPLGKRCGRHCDSEDEGKKSNL